MNRNVSQSRDVQISVSLSKLIPSKRNPRRVKPQREVHRQMVASIRRMDCLPRWWSGRMTATPVISK